MNRAMRRQSGMTLIEMLTAVTILMILTAILAQVFFEATRATAKGRGLTEIYQSARALKSIMSRDISGATPAPFVGGENGFVPIDSTFSPLISNFVQWGPYNVAQYGLDTSVAGVPSPGPADPTMLKMIMGGSDYLAFTSANAGSSDKSVGVVMYVLRASGELIREVEPGYKFSNENDYVIAENVLRMKFSYLDRGAGGPFSDGAAASVQGAWVDSWDWTQLEPPHLPAAIKVQLQIVDHQWKIAGDNSTAAKNFDPIKMKLDANSDGIPDNPEAGDLFDPNNGEAFTFIVDLPRGMQQSGG